MLDFQYELESLKKRVDKLEQKNSWQFGPYGGITFKINNRCIGEVYCTVCMKIITGTCFCIVASCPDCGKNSLVDVAKSPERLQ